MPKQTLRWVAGSVVVLLLVGGGVYGLRSYQRVHAASAAPQFFTVPAGIGPVQVSVSGTGSIQAATTDSVSPSAAGPVASVAVQVGQQVTAGAFLFRIADTQGYAQQVTAAQASLAQAQSQLLSMQAPAESVSPLAVQAASIKVKQSQITLRQAQLNLKQQEAALATDARATTPVAGVVQAVDVVAGQSVTGNATLASVLPTGAPTVSVPVPESELPYLPVGTSAAVLIPSLATTTSGSVRSVGTTPVSGGVAVNAVGQPLAHGSSTGTSQTEQFYPLTLTLAQPLTGAPHNASVQVTFTPASGAPAGFATTWGWDFTGNLVFPAAVTIPAPQTGTVGAPVAVDAHVHAGQVLAMVTNPNAASTLQSDRLAVTQDALSLQSAEVALQQVEHPQGATAAAIAAQQAQVASALQTLRLKQADLAALTVRAPVGGTVTAVNVSAGQSVGTGTSAIVIEPLRKLEAQVSVDELSIGKVHAGQAVQLVVNAFPKTPFTGKVVLVAPTAQAQNGVSMYPVTIAVSHPGHLLPGMSVTANILIASVARALRVPAQAVTTLRAGQGIVRVLRGGKPTPVRVRVGLVGGQYTQILSGVTAGTPVIAGQASSGSNGFAFFRAAGGRPGGGPGGGARGGGNRGG